MPVRPRVLHSDSVYRLACWHNAVLVDVAGNIDLHHMKRLGRAYRELLVEYPNGILSCAIIRPGVPIAAADARTESARFMKELGESLLRVAMLIEDQGVLAQVMQTVIRGINVLARNPKLMLFRSLDEAASSLAPLVATAPGSDVASELLAAIALVRSDYVPETAPRQPSAAGR